jgi:hypothetical protein
MAGTYVFFECCGSCLLFLDLSRDSASCRFRCPSSARLRSHVLRYCKQIGSPTSSRSVPSNPRPLSFPPRDVVCMDHAGMKPRESKTQWRDQKGEGRPATCRHVPRSTNKHRKLCHGLDLWRLCRRRELPVVIYLAKHPSVWKLSRARLRKVLPRRTSPDRQLSLVPTGKVACPVFSSLRYKRYPA